jgi:hypothetical protein
VNESVVHLVEFDVERYQSLLIDLPEPPLETFLFAGSRKSAGLQPLPVYVDQPRLLRPDVWNLVGCAVIVVRDEVLNSLEPSLSVSGEFLPLTNTDSGEEFLALNVLRDVNCLDTRRSSLDVMISICLQRAPTPRVPGLFKIPETDSAETLHLSRSDDDGPTFMSRVSSLGLQGERFTKLWSSVTGAVPKRVELF